MGLGDEKLMFSENQEILTAVDEASEDTIDFQATTHNLGVGTDLKLEMVVTTAFTGLDSGMIVSLQSDEDNGFATSNVTEFVTRTIAASELTLGARFEWPLPSMDMKRHLRVWYDTVSQVATAGAVTTRIISGSERRTV